MGTSDIDRRGINVIRGLSMDAVQKANSGHPGTPMALAPLAHVLFTRIMKYDASAPDWPDRDRFVLSNGHASMLLYSMLFLTGFGIELDDLRQFRQWGSRTAGHPEYRHAPGIEVTTGPLGQGFANGVGIAFAEANLRARFGPEVIDHHVFVHLRRRRPRGGREPRGGLDRRAPRPRPARVRLRRQPHHDRRPHRAGLHRRRAEAVRGLRLARRAAR